MAEAARNLHEAGTVSPLRAYIDQMNDLPPDVLLGRIAHYTITDEPVRRDDVVDWFRDLGLNEDRLPLEIKAVDAFKKATSDTKNEYPMAKGRTGNLLCRDVTTTPDYVTRQITREIRDAKNKRLEYAPAINCRFYRPTSADQSTARVHFQVNSTVLEPSEIDFVKAAAQEIFERYERHRNFLDGQKLRGVVRDYLKRDLNAIEIKGGVYFVHCTRDEELQRLRTLVDRFGGGCQMHTIPMVDLEEQRAHVTRLFEQEASRSLAEVAREAHELLASPKITPRAYAKLKEKYDDLLERATDHMINLQVSQDVTASSAEVALEALKSVQKRMIEEDD